MGEASRRRPAAAASRPGRQARPLARRRERIGHHPNEASPAVLLLLDPQPAITRRSRTNSTSATEKRRKRPLIEHPGLSIPEARGGLGRQWAPTPTEVRHVNASFSHPSEAYPQKDGRKARSRRRGTFTFRPVPARSTRSPGRRARPQPRSPSRPPPRLTGTGAYDRRGVPTTAATSAAQGMLRSRPDGIRLGTGRSHGDPSGSAPPCRRTAPARRRAHAAASR